LATERNPFETIPEEVSNIVNLPTPEEAPIGQPTFEMDTDGGVIVDLEGTSPEMGAEESIQEWYGNLVDTLEEEQLANIANEVIDCFTSDRDSRQEWESMFERGFDLLGLKIQDSIKSYTRIISTIRSS